MSYLLKDQGSAESVVVSVVGAVPQEVWWLEQTYGVSEVNMVYLTTSTVGWLFVELQEAAVLQKPGHHVVR